MKIYEATIQRLNQLLKEQSMTPNGLAYKSGVAQATVKSILNGESKNPGIVTIKKLCDGLNIPVSEFFTSEEFKNLEQEIF